MKAHPIALVAVLAACQPASPTSDEQTPAAPAPAGDASEPLGNAPVPTPQASATPIADPRFEPPALVPDAEKGEKGARNVLLSWSTAMENRDFAAARTMFGESGSDANDYSGYREIAVGFGDGDVEGAAGSLYYDVPVWMTATTANGPVRREGTITLRRVNDVEGATPAQLRWHIGKLDW